MFLVEAKQLEFVGSADVTAGLGLQEPMLQPTHGWSCSLIISKQLQRLFPKGSPRATDSMPSSVLAKMEIPSPMLSQSPVILKSVCGTCASGSVDPQDAHYPSSYEGLEEELSQTEVKQKWELRDKSSRGWLPGCLSLVSSPLIILMATNSLICAGGFYR